MYEGKGFLSFCMKFEVLINIFQYFDTKISSKIIFKKFCPLRFYQIIIYDVIIPHFNPHIQIHVSCLRFPSEPPPPGSHGTTSPQLFISRFTNTNKPENNTTVASQTPPPPSKESAKKRFASYVRLRLGGDRSASPEPPPRLSRGESPLAMRRNFPEQASPSFPRRYNFKKGK